MDPAVIEFDFLKAEADLIGTFINLAEIEASLDPEAYARALENATHGVETLQHFLAKPLKITLEQLEYLRERCSILEASLDRVRSATN